MRLALNSTKKRQSVMGVLKMHETKLIATIALTLLDWQYAGNRAD
jgi:hypothetical protein